MIMKDKQIVDMKVDSSTGKSEGFLSPVVGVENGLFVDYDRKKEQIYWVEVDDEASEKGKVFSIPIGGGNKSTFIDLGIIGSPYAMAYDWIGQNMYIGNRIANNIEVFKIDGDTQYQSIILDNNGKDTGVGRPKSMALHPMEG